MPTPQGDDRLVELARGLHEEQVGRQALRSDLWRRAFLEVPRHWFVPDRIFDNVGGRWEAVDRTDPPQHDRWFRLVYQDAVCVTQVDGETPASSNSAPSLVAATLEALSAEEGMSVLEIGTGTGWTAALLSAALGDGQVTTIDVQDDLVTDATARLAAHGWTPTVATADGWSGYPPAAPYDRLLATCAVREVPAPWIGQLVAGGRLVVNLRGDLDGGLIVLDRNADGSAHGRFLPDLVSFMMIQSPSAPEPDDPAPAALIGALESGGGAPRTSPVTPGVLTGTFAFFAQLHLPGVRHLTYFDIDQRTGGPGTERLLLFRSDGSIARATSREDGTVVCESGPVSLWTALEVAERTWQDLGKPDRDRFEVAVEPDGSQYVRLGERRWPLPL